ncbi:hypothetical protein V6N13_126887 [Hibiscus sabdariffa]
MDSRTGELITAPQAQNSVFIWEIQNPLYFKIVKYHRRPFNRNYNVITIQIRFNYNLRQALSLHKCFLNFTIWTRSRLQIMTFFHVFSSQILNFLDDIGAIGINNDLGRENVKESHNLQTRPRPYCEVQEAFVKRQSLSEVVVEAYLNRYDIVIPVEWSSVVFDNLEIKGILNLPNKNGILCLRCSDEFPGA